MKQHRDKDREKGAFLFFKWVGNKVMQIFQPEEVEVTFNGDGKNVTYTYTKVSHKQIA